MGSADADAVIATAKKFGADTVLLRPARIRVYMWAPGVSAGFVRGSLESHWVGRRYCLWALAPCPCTTTVLAFAAAFFALLRRRHQRADRGEGGGDAGPVQGDCVGTVWHIRVPGKVNIAAAEAARPDLIAY